MKRGQFSWRSTHDLLVGLPSVLLVRGPDESDLVSDDNQVSLLDRGPASGEALSHSQIASVRLDLKERKGINKIGKRERDQFPAAQANFLHISPEFATFFNKLTFEPVNESGRDQYWTVVPSDGNLLTSSLFSTTTLRVKSSFRVLMNEKKNVSENDIATG